MFGGEIDGNPSMVMVQGQFEEVGESQPLVFLIKGVNQPEVKAGVFEQGVHG